MPSATCDAMSTSSETGRAFSAESVRAKGGQGQRSPLRPCPLCHMLYWLLGSGGAGAKGRWPDLNWESEPAVTLLEGRSESTQMQRPPGNPH